MDILIVKLSSLGDVVHALPTLECLRAAYPKARISWLVESEWAPIISGHPALDEVIVSSRRPWLKRLMAGDLAALREAFFFVGRLRKRRFDIVLDLQGLIKSGLLVGLVESKRKVGWESAREYSHLFYSERLPSYDPDTHAVLRYLSMAEHLGAKAGKPVFRIPWSREEELRVKGLLAPIGSDKGPLVVMNPAARWRTKRWGEDGFRQTARKLMEEAEARVVFVGGPGDRQYISRASRGLNSARALDLSGRTNLKDLACLLEKADLMVTTDSGPMHIAAAVGTRVLAVFGPTDPRRTGPFGRGHRVVTAEVTCRPCFRRRCPTRMECMSRVGAGEVAELAMGLLSEDMPSLAGSPSRAGGAVSARSG